MGHFTIGTGRVTYQVSDLLGSSQLDKQMNYQLLVSLKGNLCNHLFRTLLELMWPFKREHSIPSQFC